MAVPGIDEWLISLLSKLRVPCAGARVTFAAGKRGDATDLITGRCEFSCAKLEPRKGYDYGTIVLGEQWLDVDEAKTFLSSLAAGTAHLAGVDLGGKYVVQSLPPERKVAPVDGVTGWSEWAYDLHRDGDRSEVPDLFAPLVRTGLRPYKAAANAVAAWVWAVGDSWNNGQPPQYQEVRVAIPDSRARITSVEWLPGRLRAAGEFAIPHDEVEIQAVLQLLGRTETVAAQNPNAECLVEWEIDSSAVRAEIYIVHKDGDLLWQADVRNTGSQVRTPAHVHSPQEVADRDLVEGESDQVEFKPFLVDSDDSGKAAEFVRTIVAFANSAGGRLYIGVRDDASPEGRARFLKSAATDPDRAEDALKARMAKLIADKIKPVPKNFSMDVVEAAGEPILMVTIRRGDDGPYATHENDIYVRKGGTNRRPDPQSELRGLYPAKPPRGANDNTLSRPGNVDDEGGVGF